MRNHRIVHGNDVPGQVWRRLAGVLLIALFAAGCQTTPTSGDYRQAEVRADSLSEAGRHQDAARIYIALAGDVQGGERNRLTLLAVEEWLLAGDTARASNAFASTTPPDDPDARADWTLTAARLDLAVGRPDAALDKLASLGDLELRVEQRLRRDALRGTALFDTGRPLDGLALLVRRELWLDGATEVRRNHDIIWAGLIATPPATLEEALAETNDPTVRGWLALGLIGAGSADDPVAFRRGLIDWRREYPDHPASADLLPSLLDVELATGAYPRQIAVLLPLSGRSGAAGVAIREGMLGAWYNALREGPRPVLRFYDVAADGNVSSYRRALEEGAEFVIGPLLKSSVMDIATGIEIQVPTLALNTLPEEIQSPARFYQFALAPEDEAAQVGSRAVLDDRPRGVALIPRSEWGDRVLDAFAASLQASGGRLLDFRRYEASESDFSDPIESLLLLDESVARYRELRRVLGEPVQFEPRRRGDVDFIFLAADGTRARLLRPQLRFHYAGDIPVYATSAVNGRDGRSNSDLNGVLFPEIPWIVSEGADIVDMRQTYESLWPASEQLSRLNAMGYDAYRLVGALQAGNGSLQEPLVGMTGELSMSLDGRVHRRLPFAKFEGGEIVAVAEPVPDTLDEADVPGVYRIPLGEPLQTPGARSWEEPDASD
ncbi:MAG: penicillin-binding protein activator [Gammaproteobacteria bacterium]